MLYEYENFKYVNQDNKGILYKDGRILFIGNSWSGIMQFLQYTDNAQVVRDMFKAQLEQREVIKLRAEAKQAFINGVAIVALCSAGIVLLFGMFYFIAKAKGMM